MPRLLRGKRKSSRTCRRQLAPKILEPVWRHFGVSDRVLDVLVPEVVLQRPRVVAIVGELKPTSVAKHVWVDREGHLVGVAVAVDDLVEVGGRVGLGELGSETSRFSRGMWQVRLRSA